MACAVLGLIFGITWAWWSVQFLVGDSVVSRAVGAYQGVLLLLPGRVYNALIPASFVLCCVSLLAASGVALVAGIRALRLRGGRIGAIALIAVGGAIALLLIGAPWVFRARMIATLEKTDRLTRQTAQSILDRLESGKLSPEQRLWAWRQYAEIKYEHEGITIQYPDESGAMVTFAPTQATISIRQMYLDYRTKRGRPYGWTWQTIATVALFVAFGLFTPIRRPAPPPGVDGGGSDPALAGSGVP